MNSLLTHHASFDSMSARWDMCAAFAEGEFAVNEAKERYLPRLQQETDDAYKLRLMMTPTFGAVWRTVVGLKGMLFRKPPQVELPAALQAIEDDIDLAGTSMLGLAQAVVKEALVLGRVGLLVDYPTAPEGITRADAVALKLRPAINLYEARSIYNWRETRQNGATTLTQVRLMETFESVDATDEFKIKSEKRYRILDLLDGVYRQRVWRLTEKGEAVQVGEDVFPTMNNRPMTYIPFVFIGVDTIGPDLESPPLVDLVTIVYHHRLQATSYERGCFFSGLPTMFISGMQDSDGEIGIGGPVANTLGNPDAKAYYVEVASNFQALRTNLEDKKAEMALLGGRMLSASRSGVEAAETVARRQSGEEAVLADMAKTVSRGLTLALQWAADWLGAAGPVTYELNRDFLPQSMTAQDLTALVGAWQSGALSAESLFDQLKQGEIISDDTDFATEQERISSAQATIMAQNQASALSDAQMQADFAAQQAALTQGAGV